MSPEWLYFILGLAGGACVTILIVAMVLIAMSEPVVDTSRDYSPWPDCSKREHFGPASSCPHCTEDHLRGLLLQAQLRIDDLERRSP